MTDIAIHAENLSKKYRIGAMQREKSLREALTDVFSAPFRRAGKLLRGQATGAAELDETIWALRDISFEVRQGEAIGVIGGNGAGKSTLLKILSRITEPTTGYAEIRGRVGSLLEVGTGFHPELTGRENIYLNGAILGMKKVEILKKFDEIVAFSEVEKFIDTPVKHYSSGMYLRLAFAVAAHLEPEILIVDEVLAVGDGRFQKKCVDKMQDVEKSGNTIIFVSHNMEAILRLCKRAILLQDGRIVKEGTSHEVVAAYLSTGFDTTAIREWPDIQEAPGGELARLRAVRVKNGNGQISETIDIRKPVNIEMEFDILKGGHVLVPQCAFYNDAGLEVFGSDDLDPSWRGRPRPAGRWISTCTIPGNFLSEGTMFVRAMACVMDPFAMEFAVPNAVGFQVIDPMEGDSARGDWLLQFGGVVRPLLQWTTDYRDKEYRNG
jgi:lipopolysaccharide transport system ATP-binding protein